MVGGFFPTPYPDECYYSILCRYFVHSGSTSNRVTISELFGNKKSLLGSLFFPVRMDCVEHWVPPESGITRSIIAEKHTMYPYIFLTCNSDFRERMKCVIDGGKNESNIYTSGIIKIGRLLPEFLRYCPVCSYEDEVKYGEAYWHRTHQLPGMLYCMKHYVGLIESNVSHKKMRGTFHAASESVFLTQPDPGLQDDLAPFKNIFLKIGRESEWLLNHGMEIDSQYNVNEKYRWLLREKGIASTQGAVDYGALVTSFNTYWGKEFLDILYEKSNDTKEWILYHNKLRISHFKPLHHILLMCFLKGSVKGFLDSTYFINPFGNGPWPCKNPVCQQHMVENTEVRYLNGKATGYFYCSHCGMTYKSIKRREKDVSEVIVEYGALWEQNLKYYLGVKKLTVSEVAEILDCKIHVIQYRKKKMGLNTNAYSKVPRQHEGYSGAEEYHKDQVLKLCAQKITITPNYLKIHYPNTYAYLVKCDFGWLKEHMSYAKDLECWHEEDLILLKKVQDAMEHIEKGERKRHITRAYIAQIAGVSMLILNTVQRRPLTKAYVDQVIESRETWLRRRIIQLCTDRKQSGFATTSFANVKRELSLKPNASVTYQKLIEEVLNDMNQKLNNM